DEYHRDVQTHGCHQHAGSDLVTVGDADQCISAVSINHVLHRIRDDVAGRQAVQHAVVAHGDTVVHRNGVELFGDAARFLDFPCYQLAEVFQMHMAWHELGKGVGNGDDGFIKVAVFHAGCTPQRA